MCYLPRFQFPSFCGKLCPKVGFVVVVVVVSLVLYVVFIERNSWFVFVRGLGFSCGVVAGVVWGVVGLDVLGVSAFGSVGVLLFPSLCYFIDLV